MTHIYEGEAEGAQRYSALQPDTTGWNAYDWQAYLLFQLNFHSTRNRKGPFYGKNLSDEEKYTKLHAVIKKLTHDLAPARRAKGKGKERADAGGEDDDTAISQEPAWDEDYDEDLQPVNKKGGQVKVMCKEVDMPQHWADDCEANEATLDDFIAAYQTIDDLEKAIEGAFDLKYFKLEVAGIRHENEFLNQDAFGGFRREVASKKMPVIIDFIVRALPPDEVLQYAPATDAMALDEGYPEQVVQLDPFRLMCQERGPVEWDLRFRYWRWRLVRGAATMYSADGGVAVLERSAKGGQVDATEANWRVSVCDP